MNRCEVGIGRDSCRFLAPLTVFLPALFLASFTISDPDTFFHLTFGKIIVASGLPTTNTVSFTWGSYPWKNTEWLFGVILYLLHSLGGEVAISAFQALVVAAAFSLTADTVRRRLPGLSPVVWLVMLPLFLAALAASQFRFVPRPQLVSFLGLSLLLNLWERRPRRLPLWFGLTGCAWANLHPGVIFGLAVCLALVVSSARSRERFGPAVCAGVAFFAGTLVNPYFFHPYVYAASHLFISERVSLVEFAQPTLAQNGTFFVLAALAVLAIPQRWRRGDVLHPLLVAGFLALSLYVVRFVPKFLLLALPGLCQTAAELVSTPERSRRRIAALALFALGVCLLLFAGRDVFFRTHHDPFGWGLNERRIPAGAADFISSRSLRGRMYNDFQQGGYLMWRLYPGQRVFQDGRNFAYPPEFLREVASISPEEWPEVLNRYGIQIAVIGRGPHEWAFNKGRVFDALGWTLVHCDGVSLVYVRPGSPDAGRVGDLALRWVRPWLSSGELESRAREHPSEVLAELRRLDPERFQNPAESYVLGWAASRLGDLSLTERFLRAGMRSDPADPSLELAMAVNLERQGRRQEALNMYQEYEENSRSDPRGTEFARQRREALGR